MPDYYEFWSSSLLVHIQEEGRTLCGRPIRGLRYGSSVGSIDGYTICQHCQKKDRERQGNGRLSKQQRRALIAAAVRQQTEDLCAQVGYRVGTTKKNLSGLVDLYNHEGKLVVSIHGWRAMYHVVGLIAKEQGIPVPPLPELDSDPEDSR